MTLLRGRAHVLLVVALLVGLVGMYHCRSALRVVYAIARMPLAWRRDEAGFLIAADPETFDVFFAAYNASQTSAAPEFQDLVPPVLHHIALGEKALSLDWQNARETCLDLHPGWRSFLWTDEQAEPFVRDTFPEMWDTWRSYRYPIQRIDALRYLVLYHYGGVVLDMDLKCTRSLGPLRRFGFVAPAAHPAGFSIGFMMARARHPFVRELVSNLPVYDRWWFGLPYPRVMFSTGCHYASTIHTLQPSRSELKILSGPPSNRALHSLNGHVRTPLFHHLGSSSWHAFDAALIVRLGRSSSSAVLLVLVLVLVLAMCRRGCAKYTARSDRYCDVSFYSRVLQGCGCSRRKGPDDGGWDRMA